MCTALCLKLIHPYLLLGLYNSSFHNLVIHYTNLYCCHIIKLICEFNFMQPAIWKIFMNINVMYKK